MNICLFSAEELERPLDLRDGRAEHIIKVLHKQPGDTFAAGVIGGRAGTARITAIARAEGTLSFTFTPETDGKPLHPLSMLIGFPRPIQLKRLLRDMAGLGVQAVHLVGTELGEKSYLQSGLATTDAGRTMLREGCEQAASTHLPELRLHRSLAACLDALDGEGGARFALDNVRASGSLQARLVQAGVPGGRATAAIGSERGWTDRERALLEGHGYERLSMGNRVLRTETAATVAASLILGAMGALD